MFYGKMKALTFSYDDGVTQDRRLVELFDRYGLKATFNINSELLGKPGTLWRENMWVDHNKIRPEEAAELYRNHEVAVHTLTHPHLTELEEPEIIRQVEEDRIWGHSYEFDYHDTWGEFEKFCQMMSGRDDIFYGTNHEVLNSLYHA